MIQSDPLISVLLPTYNSSRTIKEAIDSILCQSYEKFELLIIDGGSSDGTLDIINDYNDDRIKLHVKPGMGLGEGLNYLINISNGIYLARMDSDDVAQIDRLNLQMEYLNNNDSCVLVGTQIEFYNGEFNISRTPFPTDHQGIMTDLQNCVFSVCRPSVMFRTHIAREVGGYKIGQIGEDLLFFLELSNKGMLANINYVGLWYRYSSNSLTSTREKESELMYSYTLHNWLNKDSQINLLEYEKIWANKNKLNKFKDYIERKGNRLYKKYILHYGRNPFLSKIYLFAAAICKPQAVFRQLKQRLSLTA